MDRRKGFKAKLRLGAKRKRRNNIAKFNAARRADLPCLTQNILNFDIGTQPIHSSSMHCELEESLRVDEEPSCSTSLENSMESHEESTAETSMVHSTPKGISVDGSPWSPRRYDLICSAHFIGGKKSDDPANPSYVPTIFPEIQNNMKNYKENCIMGRSSTIMLKHGSLPSKFACQSERLNSTIGEIEKLEENGAELHLKPDLKTETDETVKIEKTEHSEDQESYNHLKFQKILGNTYVDTKLEDSKLLPHEVDFPEFIFQRDIDAFSSEEVGVIQAKETVKAERSSNSYIGIKSENCNLLQHEVHLPEFIIKRDIDDDSSEEVGIMDASEIVKVEKIANFEDEDSKILDHKVDFSNSSEDVGGRDHDMVITVEEKPTNAIKCTCKSKSELQRHMTHGHADPLQKMKLFRCEKCNYQCRLKSSLQNHMLVHKDLSDVEMFKCNQCGFETKHRRSLFNLLLHEAPTKMEIFKCEVCSNQFMLKSETRGYTLLHKNPS